MASRWPGPITCLARGVRRGTHVNALRRRMYKGCTGPTLHGLSGEFWVQIWLPLVDGLRTLLLAPTPAVREILHNPWAHRPLGAPLGT
jgi:hypothetical protein